MSTERFLILAAKQNKNVTLRYCSDNVRIADGGQKDDSKTASMYERLLLK